MADHNNDEASSYVSSSEDNDEQLLNVAGGAGREEDWDEWQGEAGDADEDETKSLFGPERLPNPEAAMEHDAAKYGFDIRQFAIQQRLDEYGIIRVINYIRSEVAADRDPLPVLAAATCSGGSSDADAAAATTAAPWLDDQYLVPAIEDDALLFYDFEDLITAAARATEAGLSGVWVVRCRRARVSVSVSARACINDLIRENTTRNSEGGTRTLPISSSTAGGQGGDGAATAASAELVALLREENEVLRATLAAMRQEFLPEELREAEGGGGRPSTSATAGSAGPSTSGPPPPLPPVAAAAAEPTTAAAAAADPEAAAAVAAAKARKVDAAYFDSYSYFDIHREMLGDKPRTQSYQAALERNPRLMRGAAVLDVGCGTGILSLFACRGGAARVLAVDGSERIAGFAKRHAELAGFSDSRGGPMTVVSGKLEELGGKLPVEQVDVIVSEWMGYALLFEAMLDTVLHARDVYLRPGGALLPDRASIFIAGACSAAGGLGFWSDVYGFDMSPVAEAIAEAGKGQAVVLEVRPEHILTDTACVKELDLCTMRPEDQDFTAEFRLQALPPPPSSLPSAAQQQQQESAPEQRHHQQQDQQPESQSREVGCIVLWFDTAFSERHCAEHPVVLSTSPYQPTTHWVQTLLTLRKPVPLLTPPPAGSAGGRPGALSVSGRISMVRSSEQHRSLDIGLQYRAELSDGSVIEEAQLYHMSVTAPS